MMAIPGIDTIPVQGVWDEWPDSMTALESARLARVGASAARLPVRQGREHVGDSASARPGGQRDRRPR